MPTALAFEFILLAAIWGASFLLMRLGAAEFGSFVTAFLRVLLASVFLLPVVALRGQWPTLRRHWRAIAAVGVFNSGIPFALFSFAVLHITTGLSSILNATTPLWGALVAWAWLKDRPAPSRVAGLVIGFVGVALLAWDKATFKTGTAAPGLAVLACLGATLCYGLAASMTKKYLRGVSPLASAAGSQVSAALLLALPAALTLPAHAPGAQAWAAVAALALLCTALAYVMYFHLIERVGPARTVSVTFLIPVFGVAYGAALLAEPVTLWMLGCGAVVVLGTALATGALSFATKKIAT